MKEARCPPHDLVAAISSGVGEGAAEHAVGLVAQAVAAITISAAPDNAPGVVLLLVPVLFNRNAPEIKFLSATLGVLALLLPAWMTLYVARRDKRKAALDARDEIMEPLKLVPENPSPSAWLRPRWSTSKFYGRQGAQRDLDEWLQSPGHPVLVIEGGVQAGKKRLAIEWCMKLGPPWVSGWLSPEYAGDAVKRIVAAKHDTVLVMDGYAPQLGSLLSSLGGTPRRRRSKFSSSPGTPKESESVTGMPRP